MRNIHLQIMESKEGIDALFLFATEGILVANAQAEIIRANPSATKLFGYKDNELIGQKIEVLIPNRFSKTHVGHRDKFIENPHARSMGLGMELYGLKKNGDEFPVEISLSPYKNDGGSFVIAFIVDITQRKLAEDQLKNYSADLENQVKNRTLIFEEAIKELKKTKKELFKALEKERELNEMKSRFVSMASHEFRTPLTTMLSSLSLVSTYQQRNDEENHSKHVRKIKSSINNLTDILNDFLSVSKLEEGKVENLPEQIDLKAFVEDVASEMNGMSTREQQIFTKHTGMKNVYLDPRLLKNILFNLISNALKFSNANGIVRVETTVESNQISVSVIDEGIGISEEDQQHLFERFFRGRNVTNIQGTGLGLSIVARYTELMNGVVSLESEVKKGTTVSVVLPFKMN